MHGNQRQTHWAYIAGIMDADGSFMIIRQLRIRENENRMRKFVSHFSPSYIPAVKISMVEKESIDFVTNEMQFGKYNLNGARKDRKNSQPIFHWYLRGRKNIVPFLEGVIPFLKVKKKRAEFLLDFCHNFKVANSKGVPTDELKYREESYLKMRELNGTKVAATTKPQRLERVCYSLNS